MFVANVRVIVLSHSGFFCIGSKLFCLKSNNTVSFSENVELLGKVITRPGVIPTPISESESFVVRFGGVGILVIGIGVGIGVIGIGVGIVVIGIGVGIVVV